MKKKRWYDFLWVAELLYLTLGLFNILFAWLGMLFFTIPLLIAVFGGGKAYCNRYCGRGQLFGLLGSKLGALTQCAAAQISEQPGFSVWVFGFFHGDVLPHAGLHLEGFHRGAPAGDGDAAVGLQAALAVG